MCLGVCIFFEEKVFVGILQKVGRGQGGESCAEGMRCVLLEAV